MSLSSMILDLSPVKVPSETETSKSQEDAVYIPPEGVYFRLLGYVSQHVLFSRTFRTDPAVGHNPMADEHDDQYFTLIHGTGSRKGTYAIKSKVTGYVLYSRTFRNPHVGHTPGDGEFGDNWFEIEMGTGKRAGHFRLVTPEVGVALFSRTFRKPYIGNNPAHEVYDDQYFSFLFEDMKVDKVEYDLKEGKIISTTPMVLTNQTLENKSDHEQEMSFALNKTVTHTSSFQYTTGFTITIGSTFSAGIPGVGEIGLTLDRSFSNEWTWGKEDSVAKSYTATFPVKAGPKQTVRAVSTVNKCDLDVPYTIYMSSKSTGTKVETKGIWRGVTTWNLRHKIE
ncbi:hypothetical protein VNI00_012617 [Paramarasmius palmivorus]|uniref:Hemolytic lectin LSLb n=2 Tax=Paramarasmius palmivorus TaxID=297713 RepID=A0AAW0C2W5_9AGAR